MKELVDQEFKDIHANLWVRLTDFADTHNLVAKAEMIKKFKKIFIGKFKADIFKNTIQNQNCLHVAAEHGLWEYIDVIIQYL